MAGQRTFISYAQESPEDAKFAQRLMDDLREAGIDAIRLENRPNTSMDEETIWQLGEHLQDSQWVILVQTPAASRSLLVQLTINIALNLILQEQMLDVISVIAVPSALQDMPPGWTTLKTLDASEDYPKALARLQLLLNPLLSASVPTVQMQAAPPPAFASMITATQASVGEEGDDQPSPIPMPLWLRQKRFRPWLITLVGVLILALVLGMNMSALANMLMAQTPQIAKVQDPRQKKNATPTPTSVATQITVVPTPTPIPTATIVKNTIVPTPILDAKIVANNLYASAMKQQPVLDDPLIMQDGNNWDTPNNGNGRCLFEHNLYNISVTAKNQEAWTFCLEHQATFTNFVYQVQMNFFAGDLTSSCGLVFRAKNADINSSYRLYLSMNGFYELDGYQKNKLIRKAPIQISNTSNTIGIVALKNDLSIFINKQFVAHVTDGAAASGSIGMVCKTQAVIAEVSFQFAQVWQLQ